MNIAIFGASEAGRRALRSARAADRVIGFVDNDPVKQGGEFCGLPVFEPESLFAQDCDMALIASAWSEEIYNQLREMGWPKEKIEIDRSPVDHDLHDAWKERHSARLEPYRGRHDGEACFILGNGPSLSGIDLDLLEDCPTFGLNKIHLLYPRTGFRPMYHVCVNRLVLDQSWEAFQKFDCPSFVSHWASRHRVGRAESTHFISTSQTNGFSKDISNTVCEGATVTYVAMQIAWFMGFHRIYLVGVDHAFRMAGEPHETRKMGAVDPNHFDPEYFANQEWQLPDLRGSEFNYRMAKEAFQTSVPSREIVDATVGGKLDVFPKMEFEEAARQCRELIKAR